MKNEGRSGVCYRKSKNGFITAEDYDEAINDLIEAKKQLRPDGNPCLVCGDSGHQAWECHHNPLVMARRTARELATYRCFHCGQAFTDPVEAEEHFGKPDEREHPICIGYLKIDLINGEVSTYDLNGTKDSPMGEV